MLSGSPHVLEHGTSRAGRWLRTRRIRIAFWIAALESIVVLFAHDISRWTVIGLAVVTVAVYAFVGRGARSDTLRQSTWILAASQLLAVLAAILAFILLWTAIVAVVVFAIVALLFLVRDQR